MISCYPRSLATSRSRAVSKWGCTPINGGCRALTPPVALTKWPGTSDEAHTSVRQRMIQRGLNSPPVVCKVMYCLNDFTAANGATRLVPRSHLTGMQPPADVPHTVDSIGAQALAGAAVIFDGRLWHGTGRNESNEPRLGLLATYCAPQFRTQENCTLGLTPEVYEQASEALLSRLGFKIWNAYGRIGHPSEAFLHARRQSLVRCVRAEVMHACVEVCVELKVVLRGLAFTHRATRLFSQRISLERTHAWTT